MSDSNYGWGSDGYTIGSSGQNSQGNHYCHRDGAGGRSGYHYSNSDGSYYYRNPNGSSYYNDGKGFSKYTSSSGKSRSSRK